MVKIKEVEVKEKHVRGAQYQREQISEVRLDVETDVAKFDIQLDENGLDVVSDQPSSLMGFAVSWEQLHALVQGDREIRSASDGLQLRELEAENQRLRTQVGTLSEELGSAEEFDADYAKPF